MNSEAIMIEITSLVDLEDLDPDDLDSSGNPVVPGAYLVRIEGVPESEPFDGIRDAASYHFHGKIPIACLDDYDILYRKASSDDLSCPGSFHDLGAFPFVRPDEDLSNEP